MNAKHHLGEYVRLVALKSDTDMDLLARWSALAESWWLLDAAHVRPLPSRQIGDGTTQAGRGDVGFLIYPLSGDRPIGHAGLFGIGYVPGQAWLGIGLGNHEHWNTRLSRDALHVVLRYAFAELGLERLLLGVFDYHARALRTFEEVGFAIKGRMLQEAGRGGHSRAGVYMDLRRKEWQQVVDVA